LPSAMASIELRFRHEIVIKVFKLPRSDYRYIPGSRPVFELRHDGKLIETAVNDFLIENKRIPSFSDKTDRSGARDVPRLSASRGPPFTALSRQGVTPTSLKDIFTPIWSGPYL
jgi:hypothetical protein